ncbi:MAG: hypothetical protein KF906_06210 [Actinobacteria bacterium]|nr:hypothetical protein [Actinomycetota bacterium]
MTKLGFVRRAAIATAIVAASTAVVVGAGPGVGIAGAAPSGLPADASVFVPVRPCRIVDTRTLGAAPAAQRNHTYEITGHCGIPGTATAVTATITVTDPPAPGYLRAWATGDPEPTGSFLNFKTPRTSTTGSGPIPLATTGTIDLRTYTTTPTHLVLDVTGYLLPLDTAPTAPAIDVVAGAHHSCLLRSDGTVACWGDNDRGQLGIGVRGAARSAPVEVIGITDATQIAAGGATSCARLAGGTVRCWGDNQTGQLGNGGTSALGNPTPGPVLGLTGAASVSVGARHTCARLAGGTATCWGDDYWGQLGDGNVTEADEPVTTPVAVSGLTGITSITAGGNHSCATVADGTVRCWGANDLGQMGIGGSDLDPHPNAERVLEVIDAVDVVAGASHTCALIDAGSVDCWGSNADGQLGRQYVSSGATPSSYPVTGLHDAVAITLGYAHSCAVRIGGTVVCWGDNALGQLGDGTTTDHNLPAPMTGITGADAVAAGNEHTCVLVAGGVIRCRGTGWADPVPL